MTLFALNLLDSGVQLSMLCAVIELAFAIILLVPACSNNNPASHDFNVEWKECAASAGAAGAFTGLRLVTRAVGTADQKPLIVAEELVWPPIERCAGMDAIIDVGVVASVDVHDEAFNKTFTPENVKFC